MHGSKWLAFGSGFTSCRKCLDPFESGKLKDGLCKKCQAERTHLGKRDLVVSDSRSIAKASREILAKIQKGKQEQSINASIAQAFIKEFGGTDAFARAFKSDFDKVRGEGLNDRELDAYERKDGTIVKYYALAIALNKEADSQLQIDASGLTDEDLKASLAGVALEMMRDNPEFRDLVVKGAIADNANLRKEVMELGGKPVLSPDKKKLIEQPEEVLDPLDLEPE